MFINWRAWVLYGLTAAIYLVLFVMWVVLAGVYYELIMFVFGLAAPSALFDGSETVFLVAAFAASTYTMLGGEP